MSRTLLLVHCTATKIGGTNMPFHDDGDPHYIPAREATLALMVIVAEMLNMEDANDNDFE